MIFFKGVLLCASVCAGVFWLPFFLALQSVLM